MIRVLCVFGDLNRGGAESMCMNLYRKIDKTKIQFDFVKHTSQKGVFEDEIYQLGGKIYTAPAFKIYNILQYKKWWKKHLKNHPEHQIIHGHYFTVSSVFFSVAKKFRRITVGHSHSTSIGAGSLLNVKHIVKIILKNNIEKISDYCLACSSEAGNFLYPNRKFDVLNNAISTDSFVYNIETRKKMRQELGYGTKDIVFCVVASFSNAKNPLGTVDIFDHIYHNNPNAKLLWVGDGPLRKSFEEKVKSVGLADVVKLLGVRNDTFDVLQAADAFILASIFEGLPVSVIEAQASSLPCLLSDVITRETDITGLCKFLPIDTPELWSQAVSDNDFNNRSNTKEKIIAAGYDVETTAKWLEDFYFSIIKERNLNDE